MQGVEFVSRTPTRRRSSAIRRKRQIQLGVNVTKGLGAGANPEVGRQAAHGRSRAHRGADRAARDMLFITAGMGGGTGTGAAPVVAEVARELGILTVAVVTKPFAFEGKRQRIAKEGLEALSQHVDSLIVIPNDKLDEVLGEQVTLDEAFQRRRTTCCTAPSRASPRSSAARA